MRLYVLISFWAGVLGIIIRVVHMSYYDWPRTKIISLAEKVGDTIIGLAITVWAGVILYA